MTELSDEQYRRLQHAIALARESLAIAVELGDDLSAFHLKHGLHSLHYTSEVAAEGHDDRETVTLTVHEAQEARSVKIRRRPAPDHDGRTP